MERQKDITRRTQIAVWLIVLFHIIGLVGLLLPVSRPVFMHLASFHLWVMLAIILSTGRSFDGRFLSLAIVLILTGFLIEWTGVHTGWLFGSYAYDDALGFKVFDVPVIIGVNWFLLVYSAGVTMQRSGIKNIWNRVICGALLLVLLDVLIEPAAATYHYWHWLDNSVPFTNYLSWFMASCALLFLFEKINIKRQSIVASVLLVAQFVFFVVLDIKNLL